MIRLISVHGTCRTCGLVYYAISCSDYVKVATKVVITESDFSGPNRSGE